MGIRKETFLKKSIGSSTNLSSSTTPNSKEAFAKMVSSPQTIKCPTVHRKHEKNTVAVITSDAVCKITIFNQPDSFKTGRVFSKSNNLMAVRIMTNIKT